ncbi:hypothetical protein PC121_g16542 [Phytophthora cactorum]|nr:hypothetical protein PC121_g16542 [Phytophthora cactorum]
MHDLQVSGTQQEYSTKFMQLLSMSSIDMPEIVKRWFYQQNLRAETNSYVSQNSPLTLKDTIERVQRFEDAHEAPKAKQSSAAGAIKQNRKGNRYQPPKRRAVLSIYAACPHFAARAGLTIREHAGLLTIRLGGGKEAVIPRRVTSFSIILPDLSIYTTGAFVMDIPELCDVMLGMPWLEEVNPIIDWTAKSVRPRPQTAMSSTENVTETAC